MADWVDHGCGVAGFVINVLHLFYTRKLAVYKRTRSWFYERTS